MRFLSTRKPQVSHRVVPFPPRQGLLRHAVFPPPNAVIPTVRHTCPTNPANRTPFVPARPAHRPDHASAPGSPGRARNGSRRRVPVTDPNPPADPHQVSEHANSSIYLRTGITSFSYRR